jgi:Cu(I)/Ag(I) efflux system membrane fusion protein
MWVMLDAYESDLPWLRYGQDVSFTTVAQPGEVFTGRIAFIDPVVDPTTQTIKVRVNVPNPQGRLKPGMFVKAIARSELAAGGRVMSADMAGKFICPMHPSIVKDHQGQCDICQMDLVATESLGYESPSEDALTPPLVIPASAPLVTGKRAIVYVELPQADQPTFEGRQIVLGPRAGEYYLVRQGLREGERVVTRGNFKIDSALQIEARPSMMSADEPPSRPTPSGQKPQPVPESFRKSLAEVLRAYLSLGEALAGDQLDLARQEAVQLTSAIRGVDAGRLSPSTRQIWERTAEILNTAGEQIAEAETLQAAREPFSPASNALAGLLRQVGLPGKEPLYEMKCPMAFDNRGANWLQRDPDVTNPYFGEAMFRCGEIVDTLPPTGTGSGEQDHGAHDHE